ncbi:MAG: STAS domain-containing protein [Phycisphaerae bacterium]|nr:STAS domain-containing protein [Phycisphaerae bacterium]
MTKKDLHGMVVTTVKGVTVARLTVPSIQEERVVSKIRDALFQLVDEMAYRKLVIDFRSVSFLSSQFISVMVSLDKKIYSIDGKLILAGLKPNLKKIFIITRLDKILTFTDDESIAVRKLQ